MKTNIIPVKTSDRNRPNKTYINQMAIFRGHLTDNEETQLATLTVKNMLQKINNRAMSNIETHNFNTDQNIKLQELMIKFVNEANTLLA